MKNLSLQTVLIANRGEIARRIQATCHAMGINTIALYTQEDQWAPYVYSATKAYSLPKNGINGYLDQDAIINIAHRAQATAIHPGYGFLAENAQFAQKVIENNFVWIGPTPKQISLLGNKMEARNLMQQKNIPLLPAQVFDTTQSSCIQNALHFAQEIGFPVLAKCAHGGGGKAMRHIKSKDEFSSQWQLVTAESKKYFDSHLVLLEKFLPICRHVEVQIAGDGNNYIHLYERECSLQRRHQKIIEEAPCSFISNKTKQMLYATALNAAKTVCYQNIGTVEFLVTPEEDIYFLEINPRLQVEHAITEMITNIDLVKLQLHLAQNKPLPLQQEEITCAGHAIECRIYSEDPSLNFIPTTGTISHITLPNKPFVRIDHDLEEGHEVTPFFDPMLFKMIAYGTNRTTTINHLVHAIQETIIVGVTTNLHFLKTLLLSNEFANGNIHTELLNHKNYLTSLNLLNSFNAHSFSSEELLQLGTLLLINATKQPKQNFSSKWKKQQWK